MSNQENGKEKEKKSNDRPKKKIPWYSALYPTYKSRSEDFKRIFKDVIPPEERLIVGKFFHYFYIHIFLFRCKLFYLYLYYD